MFFRRVLELPEGPPTLPLAPRFHYIDDQPLEITSQLKGYNLTRSCGSTLYKLEGDSSSGGKSGLLRWNVIRWLLIPVIALLLLAVALFSILGNEVDLVVGSESSVASLLDHHVARIPGSLEEYKKNWTKGVDLGSNRLDEEERKSGEEETRVAGGEEEGGRGGEDDLMYSDQGESTFIDRLISSFRQEDPRPSPVTVQQFNLQNPRPSSNAHKYGEYQAMSKYLGYSTTSLPVSPTLPSLPLKSSQGITTAQPLNISDSWWCDSPRLGMCRGVVPWDLTSRPTGSLASSLTEDALPYFELIAMSGCSPRAAQFLCSLLEPQCQPQGSPVLPPCRSICRAVAEDCSDLVLATLDLSQVFRCDNYPDSKNPSECVNLATGDECLSRELRCSDGSCVPKRWRCDGVKDCPSGADEVNCTAACPPNHFMCSSRDKCVPSDWRCDGRPDCPDRSDEQACRRSNYERMSHSHASPCPLGELRCLDGRCISPRQICDSTRDCSDGADELNCQIT